MYTLINVLGLAMGLCACIVIYTITSYEFSFDTFHPDKNRIYRVVLDVTEKTGKKIHFAKNPIPFAAAARQKTTGIEAIAGIIPYNAKTTVNNENQKRKTFESRQDNGQFLTTAIIDPQWFSIFKYQWLAGNPTTALQSPFQVVLTESRGRQYFGDIPVADMIGKQVVYDDSLVVSVTGIVKDWNENSDLKFQDFISSATLSANMLKNNFNSISWSQRDLTAWVFVKLAPEVPSSPINAQLNNLFKAEGDKNLDAIPRLESLSQIHFNADIIENPIRTAHQPTLWALVIIAIFILSLAIINFINLSTAQSMRRSKEVGIRKVLGGSRTELTFQFLAETFLLTLLALLIALFFVSPLIRAFQSYIPPGTKFQLLSPSVLLFLVAIAAVVTLLSGWYPARRLSSFLPALALSKGDNKGGEKWILRKGLIVFQFSVSLFFIVTVVVMTRQLNYMRNKDLGFNAQAILTISTPFGDSLSKIQVLKNQLKQITGVDGVALQWVSPMVNNGRGRDIKFHSTDTKETGVVQVAGNEDFIPLYQIKLLAGRNLQKADSMKEFVINETLSKMMGASTPDEAIGQTIFWDNKPYPVVGVVKDFHTRSLHESISPMCLVHRPDRETTLALKLRNQSTSGIQQILSQIEKDWRQLYPGKTFSFDFYDQSLAMLYEKDTRAATLMNAAMLITIFISCMGLFGLSMYTAQRRKKEIGIRKLLGATASNIAILMGKEFVKLVLIAIIIATPLSWWAMNTWLQNFAYREAVRWWIFILAGGIALVIAAFTVCYQSFRAALANPVTSLRSE